MQKNRKDKASIFVKKCLKLLHIKVSKKIRKSTHSNI